MRIVDASTVEVTADFDESTKNVDGSVLADLAYSSVYVTSPAGTIKSSNLAATKLAGGGHVTAKIIVNAPADKITTLIFTASETDTNGNEGPKTAPVTLLVDRMSPASPASFTVA